MEMTNHPNATHPNPRRLLWVGIIAAVAGVLSAWLRMESLPIALVLGAAAAGLSIAIVWFVDWSRGRA
jgi:nicotinamide riboside transporter PnuC